MRTVHVVPLRDLIEHTVPGGTDGYDTIPGRWLTIEAVDEAETEPCLCAPAVEHVPNGNGPDGWLVVHASLDGREAHE